MTKDYYAILGVLPDATPNQIRSAYRSCAKQFHPDHFGRDTAPFLKVQEAYDVLSNPQNKASYDRKGAEAGADAISYLVYQPEIIKPRRSRGEPPRSGSRPVVRETIDPLDFFRTFHTYLEEIFDSQRNAFWMGIHRKDDVFRTLAMEIVLTADQAYRGGIVRILLLFEAACPTCRGGNIAGAWQCRQCDGTGAVMQEIPLEIEYPPGIHDGYQAAIPLEHFGLHDLCQILIFRISALEGL